MTADKVSPATIEDLADWVRSAPEVNTSGSGIGEGVLRFDELPKKIDFKPEDQVVIVSRSVSLEELQLELSKRGQCIPILPVIFNKRVEDPFTMILTDEPHLLEGACGSWRDWVLGMRLVMADGTLAKTGSEAVKNVAGYDVHKLIIGSRETLAIPYEVILRTFPIKALPKPNFVVSRASVGTSQVDVAIGVGTIQRVLASQFDSAQESAGDRLLLADLATQTLWLEGEPIGEVEGWFRRIGAPMSVRDPIESKWMRRAKDIFDPAAKLNPSAVEWEA